MAFQSIYGEQALVARERFFSLDNDATRIHPEYVNLMRTCGFDFFGQNEDGNIFDAFKYAEHKHPFYVGVEFQPEYSSRALGASDEMVRFVMAVHDYRQKKREE
jgi:CTP synthase (UTP-ammonia lyase)